MSVEKITRIVGLVWLPVLLIGVHAGAQNVVFTTLVSAQKIGLNDRLEITYELKDVNSVSSISNGGFKDFIVVAGPSSSSSSQIMMTGGRTVQSTVFRQTYIVQPRHTGTLLIPAATAQDGAGHTYHSNTLKVQVVPGSVAPQRQQGPQQAIPRRQTNVYDPFAMDEDAAALAAAMMGRQRGGQRPAQRSQPARQSFDPARDVMVRVVPDKTQVHLGEQVTLSYKLYTRVPVVDADMVTMPSADGCWTQELEVPQNPEPVREVVNGRPYAVYLLKKTALFPQQTGSIQLKPVAIRAGVRLVQEMSAADPALAMNAGFADPFAEDLAYYRDVAVDLKTEPVQLQVADVPAVRPAGYNGAIGQFNIAGRLNTRHITTDDVVNYTLTISGRGNIKLFGAPGLKVPAGLQVYEPQISDSVSGLDDALGGTKTIVYTLTASKAGEYELPAVSFTFFNAETGAFETVQTDAQRLSVRPGKGLLHAAASGRERNPAALRPNAAKLTAERRTEASSLLASPLYWCAYGLPLLAVAGIAAARRRRAGRLSAGRRADQQALRRLSGARGLMQPGSEKAFYEEVSNALWLYLSDRLYIPPSQLSRAAATAALGSRRVPTAVTMKLEGVLQDCDMALYAPNNGAGQMQHAYHAAAGVISEIETYLQA